MHNMQPNIDLVVLGHIQMHKAVGISIAQLTNTLGESINRVRHAIERLRLKDKIKHGYRDYKAVLWIPYDAPPLVMPPEPAKRESNAHIHRPATGLTKPKNGPGHSKKADPVMGKPAFVPVRNGTMPAGNWTPPQMECTRPDGTAFLNLKSIDRGRELERKPPMIICVGVRDNKPIASGRSRRLA